MAFRKPWSSALIYNAFFLFFFFVPFAIANPNTTFTSLPPSSSSSQECPDCVDCRRKKWNVLWGGLVTLGALLVQGLDRNNVETNARVGILGGKVTLKVNIILEAVGRVFLPEYFVIETVMLACMALGLRKRAPLSHKDESKILASAEVWIGFPSPSDMPQDIHLETKETHPPKDALIVGSSYHASEIESQETHQESESESQETFYVAIADPTDFQRSLATSFRVKECLLKAKLLPDLEQLKTIQAKTFIASSIVGMQGLGYLFQVLVRLVVGLRVSPVEAMSVLIYCVVFLPILFHPFLVSCNRPLLLHLKPQQHVKFLQAYQETENIFSDNDNWLRRSYTMAGCTKTAILFGMSMVVIVIIPFSFAILYFKFSYTIAGISMLPYFTSFLAFFAFVKLLERVLNTFTDIELSNNSKNIITVLSILMIGSFKYILVVVATMKYWHLYEMPSPPFSSTIPHIG